MHGRTISPVFGLELCLEPPRLSDDSRERHIHGVLQSFAGDVQILYRLVRKANRHD
jgi:hypothetical protein